MLISAATDTKQIRSFGLIMAVFFGVVLGLGPLIKMAPIRVWPLPVAAFFLLFACFFPPALKPLYQGWMFIGGVLGWINTRIILGVIFFILFTPTAFLRRLFGKDSLGLKYDPNAKTYRTIIKASNTDMTRQF